MPCDASASAAPRRASSPTIVESHLRPGQMSSGGPPTQRAVYRFFRDTGDAALDILFLTLADNLAARGPRHALRRPGRQHVAFMNYILARHYLEQEPQPPSRLVTGDDLMAELDIAPGSARRTAARRDRGSAARWEKSRRARRRLSRPSASSNRNPLRRKRPPAETNRGQTAFESTQESSKFGVARKILRRL